MWRDRGSHADPGVIDRHANAGRAGAAPVFRPALFRAGAVAWAAGLGPSSGVCGRLRLAVHDTAFEPALRGPWRRWAGNPRQPSYPPRPPEARQMPPVVQSLRRVTHLIAPVPRAAQSCLQRGRERRRGHVVKGHVTRTAGSATADGNEAVMRPQNQPRGPRD